MPFTLLIITICPYLIYWVSIFIVIFPRFTPDFVLQKEGMPLITTFPTYRNINSANFNRKLCLDIDELKIVGCKT